MTYKEEARKQQQLWNEIWTSRNFSALYGWEPMDQAIYEAIRQTIRSNHGLQIAEAGSGTGKISLRLAVEGANVTLIDFSENALKNSRQAFSERNVPADFVQSDIRNINLPDAQFDITWNAGVIEHFEEDIQAEMIREMARITKPGGSVIVMVPNAKCLPYVVGKHFAEEQGTWPFGKEIPTYSLKNVIEQSGLLFREEKHTDFFTSLYFLDYIPGSGPVKQAMLSWYEKLPLSQRDEFPGYLLVAVCTVPSKDTIPLRK